MLTPGQWLDTVQVQGRIATKSGVAQGLIWFVPDEVLIRCHGKNYATIGCWRALDKDGGFVTHLSRCDIPGQEFTYDVYLGEGHWRIQVLPSEDGSPRELSDLLVDRIEP